MTDERTDAWTYDDFAVGADLGRVEVTLDERRRALWNRIYGALGDAAGAADDSVPEGLFVAAMMEGFVDVIQPRPPGNVHAGQKIVFAGTPIRPGGRLSLAFTCVAKEIKRGRRWLTFEVAILEGPRAVARGEITTIWAR